MINDNPISKFSELGWADVPVVFETYGAWGKEATVIISAIYSRLATSMYQPKSMVLKDFIAGGIST